MDRRKSEFADLMQKSKSCKASSRQIASLKQLTTHLKQYPIDLQIALLELLEKVDVKVCSFLVCFD